MLPLIMAAATAVPAAFQMFHGIKQNRMANRMKPVRPTMTTPAEMQESLQNARNMANGNMAGFGQAQVAARNATAGTARAASMMGSSTNALAALAAANSNEQNANTNLAIQNTNFKRQGMMNLQGQLGQMAGQKQKEWEWNTRQKYLEEAATKSALKQAGMTNLNNGISGLASAAAVGAKMKLGPGPYDEFLEAEAKRDQQAQQAAAANPLNAAAAGGFLGQMGSRAGGSFLSGYSQMAMPSYFPR